MPAQNLHRRISLTISPEAVRVIRTLLVQEAYAVQGDVAGVMKASSVLDHHMAVLIDSGEAQQLLDTVNTAYDEAGCGAILCTATNGKHNPLEVWWE